MYKGLFATGQCSELKLLNPQSKEVADVISREDAHKCKMCKDSLSQQKWKCTEPWILGGEDSKYAASRKNICKTIWNGIHLKVSSGGSDPIGRRGTKRSLHSMLMTPVQTTNKQTTYRKKRSKLSPSNTAAPINFLVNSVRKIASTIFSPVLNNKSTPDTHQSCESDDDSFCESEDGNFVATSSLLVPSNVDSPHKAIHPYTTKVQAISWHTRRRHHKPEAT